MSYHPCPQTQEVWLRPGGYSKGHARRLVLDLLAALGCHFTSHKAILEQLK